MSYDEARGAYKQFAFNTQKLLGSSSHRAEREVVRGSCWSFQEVRPADAPSAGGCEVPNGTAARRTLGRARVTPLDALGLWNLAATAVIITQVRPNI